MPLDDLTVVDVSSILAGPLCCQILGDFGADVIKIEHPVAGDSMRGHGHAKNGASLWWKEISRNKRTVGLDLSTPDGAEVLRRLAVDADVLVENFRPGTLERWGIGPDQLHAANAGLVLLRLTGWGQTGPYAQRPGFGTLAEAMSGFAHLTGEPDGPPTLPAFGLADSICGIAAASAALMALRHRDRTGEGQVIDISLLEPIMTAVGPNPTVYDQLGIVERRIGNRSASNAPRNTYRTSDGHWLAVSTSAQAIAERVMRLVGRADLTEQPWFKSGRGRVEHVDVLDECVVQWIGARTRAEVLIAFELAGASAAPIYDSKDIVDDPHVQATEMLTRVNDDELGPVLMHNVMWRMSKTPGRIRHTGRALGADTDAVLTALHYGADEIVRLREQGVIA
jgi:crotonobetainyl-CoA:carnitine CoA-transferase CaiB-like acyl-CoA transferase